MKWRVYYSDGGTVDSDQVEVENTPGDRVQAILWWNEQKRAWLTIQKYDRYVWKFDRWFGCEASDVGPYLLRPGWKKVLYGEYLPDSMFDAIMRRVQADRKALMRQVA